MISPMVREWWKRAGKRSGRSHCWRNRRRCTPLLVGWWSRPKLRIDFRNDADNVVSGSIKHKDGTAIEYIWLRVRVRNVGQRIAKTCQVYLTSFYKVLPGEKTAPNPVLRDAKIVQWAGGSKSPIDIRRELIFTPICLGAEGVGRLGNDLWSLYTSEKCWNGSRARMNFTLWSLATMRSLHRCKIRVKCKETAKNFEAWQVEDD